MFNKVFVRILKIIGWIVLSLLTVLILVILAIQIPSVQKRIVQKAVGFLEKKIGTPVALEELSLRFPKRVVLRGLYLQDQAKDTLLYAGEIAINTDFLGLLHNNIQLNDVTLKDVTANVSRPEKDSTFNYDYIVKAFAGDTTVVKDTTATAWKFLLYDVLIESTRLRYHDLFSGNIADLTIGTLEINTEEFDLDRMIFDLDDITLSNVTATLVQTREPEVTLPTVKPYQQDTTGLHIDFNEINLQNVKASYTQQALGQIVQLDLGKASVESNNIDLINHKIDLSDLSLSNTFISYQQMNVDGKKDVITLQDTTQSISNNNIPWAISLEDLELADNSIQYHDFRQPIRSNMIDFNHLWISKFTTTAEALSFNGNDMKGKLIDLSFHEKSGFGVRSFQTEFSLSNTQADIRDFIFDTGRSSISLNAHADFKSFETLSKNYKDARISLEVDRTHVSMRDIMFFNPQILDSLPLHIMPSTILAMEASLKGAINDLSIKRLIFQTLQKTILEAHGKINGLPDFQHAQMKISLDKFYTINSDVRMIMPDSLLPKSIRVPEWINLAGQFNGTLKTPDVQTLLTSDIGSVILNAKMNLDSTSIKQGYNGNILVKEFNVGRLLKQDSTMGKLNMTASVSGKGFKMQNLNGLVDIAVQSFECQHYTYKNFKLNGSMKQYFFSGTALLEDENLNFNIKGGLDYNEETPLYKFKFELKNADFKALNISQRPLKARGTLEVDLATTDFKVINGSIDIRKVAIFNGEKLYAVDSLLFASIDQRGQTDIRIDSDILSGRFAGTINLFSLPSVLQRYFNTYFSLQDKANDKQDNAPQNFKFNLELKKTDLITDILLPDLKYFEPGPITGEFNSLSNNLYIKVAMGKIQYSNVATDSLLININSTKRQLNYNFYLQNVMVDSLLIYGLELDGSVANDSIKTIFAIRDSLMVQKYKLGGVFNSLDKGFQFRFLKDLVVLNYNTWRVPADNYLRFGGNGIAAHNLSISRDNEKILMETKNDKDSTILVGFRALDLQNLAGMIAGNKVLVEGKLSGDINILTAKQNAFDAKVNINNLTIFKQLWGDVSFNVDRETLDRFNIKLSVQGNNANIQANGYYAVTPTASSININTVISKLHLSLIEPLTGGQTKDVKGMLTGSIKVTGDLKQPKVEGDVTFKDARFFSTYTNSTYALNNETIKFAEPGIVFNDFKILDAGNNAATLNGSINTNSFSALKFNLYLTTRNFVLLNTSAKNNDLFYGKVGLNAKAKITGTSNLPVVDLVVGLTDDSNFTYIVPQSDKGVLDQEGIVTFVDKDAKNDPFLSSINPADTVTKKFSGMELTANIELKDKEVFNVIIDPATGDKLSIQGNTTLTLKIDPTGDMELAGRYEISKGSYDLSFYKLVKRKFDIEKGSTIVWTGNPLNAVMDIRAINRVETSPMELMGGQSNDYRQRIPFLVYLIIKGELLRPEISFKLDMPRENRNPIVYSKIQDINTKESELNKQVFALLLLKRFMADNPLENQSSSGLSGTARRSVSKLLTEQLNRLSENVKGLQLSFDVKSYEDYSSGQAAGQTSLQLGLSKNLLNDRLVVKLSGNVDVEGENAQQSSFTDYIGDLGLEYKITSDGRLRITGFRNSDYDMIDGELTKTGAGLIYIKDYDAFRELFKSNSSDN